MGAVELGQRADQGLAAAVLGRGAVVQHQRRGADPERGPEVLRAPSPGGGRSGRFLTTVGRRSRPYFCCSALGDPVRDGDHRGAAGNDPPLERADQRGTRRASGRGRRWRAHASRRPGPPRFAWRRASRGPASPRRGRGRRRVAHRAATRAMRAAASARRAPPGSRSDQGGGSRGAKLVSLGGGRRRQVGCLAAGGRSTTSWPASASAPASRRTRASCSTVLWSSIAIRIALNYCVTCPRLLGG